MIGSAAPGENVRAVASARDGTRFCTEVPMRLIWFAVVVALGRVHAPLAAEAQRPSRVYRIGVLSPVDVPLYMTPFVEGLREHGWVEGARIHT